MNALSCIDQCFIADSMLDDLPTPSESVQPKSGIDLNKSRMRRVVEAVIALCLSLTPGIYGFGAGSSGRHAQ